LKTDSAPSPFSTPPTTGRDVAASIFIVGATVTAVVWAVEAPFDRVPERCETLFDHYLDLTLRDADPRADRAALVADTRRSERAQQALARCRAKITDREASCAEKADDADTFERCFP